MKAEALALSRDLAQELGQSSWLDAPAVVPEGVDFVVRSRTRRSIVYAMSLTPEGIAVHHGEGCEGEIFNGPLGCWHSKEGSTMTNQSLVPYEARPLEKIEFSPAQIQTLKNTICRGASDAELQLFTFACQDIGLNPFLKQIWAIMRNVKVSTNPDKWEKQLSIQVGIDGYRVIRDRIRSGCGAPLFEGMDGPQWSDDGEVWLDYPFSPKPKFARVAVWRRGVPRPYVAIARWEGYDQKNAMWQTMGPEQLAKCAEALAYRRAFPADMSGLPSGPVLDYPREGPAGELADTVEGEARPMLLEDAAEATFDRIRANDAPIETPRAASPKPARAPTPPVDLLRAIEERNGIEAKKAALAVMPRLFGTMVLTKLSLDDRADYAQILRFRLHDKGHAHELAYNAMGQPLCSLCGDAVEEPPAPEEAKQEVQQEQLII